MANSKRRSQSKQNYCTRNKDGAISNRNKAKRMASAKKRAEYWKSVEGKARKAEKMNTPEKIEARKEWKVARDLRRRQRALEAQDAKREAARQSADEQVKA